MKKIKNISFGDLPEEQQKLGLKIFDLVLDRVLRKIYYNFNESNKADMDKIFSSGGEKEKKDFIKKYIPDFDKIFKEEAGKIEEELKIEIEKQI
jgi:hypothetical protein